MTNKKHPSYDDNFLPKKDLFNPEFKRDSRGRYFMQLPGYGKWMVSVEPGSKIISQGSEDEAADPATDPGSIRTGSLHASTVITIGDNVYLDGGTGCIYVGDHQKRIGTSISICGSGMRGYSGSDVVFAFFLEENGNRGKGDVIIGDYVSDNYVLWDDSGGILEVKGNIIVEGDIASANYVADTSGYKLTYATGLAEFQEGLIGGWQIASSVLKKEYVIAGSEKTKIELSPGNPGHIQAAYSATGSFAPGGNVYMVQMTQGSTGDAGGTPIPRIDVYRDGTKRAMFNSSGLYFFESDGATVATSILSGASNVENFSNVSISGGDIEGSITLPNSQTIATTTAHVISTGNSHSADLTNLNDAQDYMSRIDTSLDTLAANATYIGYIWTTKLAATLPDSSGVVLNDSGIRGYDSSDNLRFLLNASTGDFYFGDYPTGNCVAWDTNAGSLVVNGEIQAISGYIGGSTSGWKIDSNVLQAYSGATKIMELSTTGPHIQCLKDSTNYVQMTPAGSDPRFDIFVGGVRRVRLNENGLTMFSSIGAVTNEIGLGVTDGDATFGEGNIRLFDNGIRISHDNGACTLSLQDESTTYLRMYVDSSQRSYYGTIDLPNSDVLTIRDKSGPPGNKIIDFVGRNAYGNIGVVDVYSPLGLYVGGTVSGDRPVPSGAGDGWIFYNEDYNEVWAYIDGSWEALDHGGGATGTVTSIATSGAITGGTITTTGTIGHSASSGYKHLPSSGGTYQTIRNSASGTGSWTSNLYYGSLSTYYIARNAGTGDTDLVVPSGKDYNFTRGGTSYAVIDNNFWTKGFLLADGGMTIGGTMQNTSGDIICDTGNLQLKKNGAIVAIDDSGGTTRYLTVQWNSTLSKYILST